MCRVVDGDVQWFGLWSGRAWGRGEAFSSVCKRTGDQARGEAAP